MTKNLTRRQWIAAAAALAGDACSPKRLELPRRAVAPQLQSFPLSAVRLEGTLGRRLDLCIRNRVFAQDPNKLIEPFRHRTEQTCWQTEFWGKWFLSAAAACEYAGDTDRGSRLDHSLRQLIATQSSDGYIGNYAPGSHLKGWDVWGRKYTLLGLLAAYDLNGDRAPLQAARRLADHLLREVGPDGDDIVTLGLYRGMASSSILQPIVRLYRATHDERYFQFAQYIVERWSSSKGPQLIEKANVPVAQRFPPPKKWWSWENGQKAYEMMSCYIGLLELYRETGWAPALDAARHTYESIRDTEINVAGSGSASECWYGGKALQTETRPRSMETCVSVTWMQFCTHLLAITGEAHFGDDIERTAYNALAGAMTPDGSSFAQYSPLEGVRSLGEQQCGLDLNCCVANGPRGMMLIPEVAVMLDAQGPAVVLYSSGQWNFVLPSGTPCSLLISTDYPRDAAAEIRVDPARPESFPLRLRVPQWSRATKIAVNGAPVAAAQPGTWAVMERLWKPGDRLRVTFDLRTEQLNIGNRYAMVRGPLALASDNRLAARAGNIEMTFPAGHDGAPLCDFASAGNTWDERSRFRTWIPT